MSFRRIILDVDAGVDDIYSILIFLYAEKLKKIKIEAITLVMGNTALDNVCKNVIRVLELMNRTDIPIYKGAKEPLILPEQELILTHYGADGFVDLVHEKEPDVSIVHRKSAVTAIGDIITENPGEITIVALGPLTNIALAFKLHDDVMKNIKDIFLMGGNYAGTGNITPAAEFNFYMDPEAAHIVLKSAECPVTILAYETCRNTNIESNWRFNVLSKINTPQMHLLNRAEEKFYTTKKMNKHLWYPCDAFLAAAIVYPNEIITRTGEHHANVELHGALTRGQMILDHLKQKQTNVTLIEEINSEYFSNFMLKVMKNE